MIDVARYGRTIDESKRKAPPMQLQENLTSTSVRTNLSRPVDFVGRKIELGRVIDALSPTARVWIISLTGVGGIGKTELAVQAAHIVAQRGLFQSIVWATAKESWLTPEGIRFQKPEYGLVSLDDLLNTVIDVLQLDPRLLRLSSNRKQQQVKEALSSTSCLLVVDNLETVQDPAVIQFLTEIPQPSKALVTTRVGGLRVHGAAIAQTLEGQREIRIGPLSEEDAIDLFLLRTAENSISFSRKEHLSELQEVVNKAACIPLAIEWIVGQMVVRHSTLDDAVNRLRLSNGEVLKYCFDNLVDAVGKKAKRLLMAVPVFTESAASDALSAVTDMRPESRDEALQRLYTTSLIELATNGRYSVLAPTRLYVSTLWRSFPDLYQDYCLRASRYYLQLLRNADRVQRWKSIEIEHHNILSLFAWCFENHHLDLVLELAHPLSMYLNRLGLWDHRAHICELATSAASNLGNKEEAAYFGFEAAEIHKHRGRLNHALDEFLRCEEHSKDVGNWKKAAEARRQIAVVLYHMGKYNEATRAIQQSLEMYRAINEELGIATNFSLMGRIELTQGNLLEAEVYFKDGLKLKEQLRDELGVAISKYDLGHLYHKQGALQMAEDLLNEALETLSQIGDKRHLSNAKWFLALLKVDRGELIAARSLLTDILSAEEAFQRDARIERAAARLAEVERAIASAGRAHISKEYDESKITRKYILSCGIEKYLHLPTVWSAGSDAEDLSRALSYPVPSNDQKVTVLTNNEATCAAVRQHLRDLSAVSDRESALIMLFVCHAVQKANRNYLCMHDTDLNNLEETAIDGLEFASLLQSIPAHHTIIFLDCHHSIETPQLESFGRSEVFSVGFSAKYLDYLASHTRSNIVVSCGDGEISHKFPDIDNRLFVHYLLKGIIGDACLRGNDLIYLLDLYYYVERRVKSSLSDQTPQLYSQATDSSLVLCTVPRPGEPQSKKEPQISHEEENRGRSVLQKVTELRESIIRGPTDGALQLSEYLTSVDFDLRNRVDLYRSELLQIQLDKEKYGSLDPTLESQRQRCIFNLLEICSELLKGALGE
ncbi:hypothetical protein ANRL4_05137 [Anaerolineae bacterium]|nr:hypothetical protein ANRL4_05137 [Anaerolineae bacterium]